ncbi:GNAT family N-acetyltransferase [Actinopolyspora saharensis]|uniref:Acetyltransferase (GNAT) family protein n=1 Tax=Actinopolyspora saharensis TaxID=995062 RepID=A0A1H1F1T7_9ACTN|nr:GNAT family N-acetyltransferase [Actinopolyspora saharensis]SDQ94850.1 Acetyltransferase (GNAT) family protein [Actinopolyspora saharensis]
MVDTLPRRVEIATPDQVTSIHRLRRHLEEWLHARGIRQWPRGEVSGEEVAAQVDRGEWRCAHLPDIGLAAAMRVLWSDPDFWGADATPAVYVHGLMVDCRAAGAGLGKFMLDSAAEIGRAAGVELFRLDCVESNHVLRAFYSGQGFREVGRRDFGNLFSVTLFERAL